jgi:hypothetical protein
MRHCETCGKEAYSSEISARRRLRRIQRHNRVWKKSPTRVYHSKACGCWHLTSRT